MGVDASGKLITFVKERMEPLMTYAERRFDGKRAFQLFADRVVIRGSEALSSEYEQIVRLDSLNAEFDRL